MKIIISNTVGLSIYEQIAAQIKTQIMNGTLVEGEQLPSIRNLAKDLQISVITTKRAYEELERDGYINTVPGKGSYIAQQNTELLREKKLQDLQDQLLKSITIAEEIGFSRDEIVKLLDLLYEEE
ncbi:GntR family transcriptional regulator [Bacillus sp. 1P06AnD]|uniref:GntR family transcriptional regulator n=1 Tax=Bacillus sp. 1P06AnD TaxID=3132208 RepID=UPI0039A143E0